MKKFLNNARQIAYTVFSFCYFLFLATDMTLRGFILLTLCGKSDRNKLRYHKILQRKSRFVINHVPGTTFSFSNPSDENFDSPSMIICNHQSHLDLMAIMMLTPKLIILTKDWVWKNPFYGIVIRYADFFPISDTEKMEKDLSAMVEKGYSVMIFPEGTRSKDCHIQRFHRGAFYLAERLGLDIVPAFIEGFGKVLPKTSFRLYKGKMSMELMPRVKREELANYGDFREVTRHFHRLYAKKES